MDPIARADPSKVKNGRMLVIGSERAEEIAAEEAHEMMRWSSEDGGEGGAATPVIGGGGDQREMPFLPIKWHLVVPDRPQGWKEVIYEFCDNLSTKDDINGSKN
ncbi:hypothetical protein E2562_024134 [Oryza meyeriana var. granulata]|uniref:Uncharacterized protein n=1 Tax=Oryza meyeriana var. granulata TaxID=110450 RepID=A0A6G1EP65_9ORYZ|nr:hypothetical protein E2562_024134 [Oryza meyeriana var. granulata]